jgi:glycosyltransferase involved in cell wall biosynthesis
MITDDLVRLERLPRPSSPQLSVIFITNMWPDENRPYYGSFIASQAKSLPPVNIAVDVLYVRGYLGAHAYLRAMMTLPRLARDTPYDLAHVHYGHTAVASLGVRGLPIVMSFCGEDLLGAPRDHGITRKSQIEVAIFRQVARRATATITKSLEMERVLPASLQSRNYIVPNGVDIDVFAPMPREQARAQLGWAPDEKVMLFLGNPDDPRKNVSLARQAADIVCGADSSARLHIAWGVGPEQVPVLMNAADCLVFSSKSEGSPNAVKEAMACALPIVATSVGDIPERLDGIAGCYVRDPSPKAFASAIVEALGSARATEARAAVEVLSVGAVANRLGAIYAAATERHRSGRGILQPAS